MFGYAVGKWWRDGTLKTVDANHFTQTVFNDGQVHSNPYYKTIQTVEAHYRHVMGLGTSRR